MFYVGMHTARNAFLHDNHPLLVQYAFPRGAWEREILPIMICAFIAAGVSKVVCPNSLYQVLALNFIDKEKS